MRKAKVFVKGKEAGTLTEVVQGSEYLFEYLDDYNGLEVSTGIYFYKIQAEDYFDSKKMLLLK